MGAFPPGEVRHQGDRGHDHLYRSHVYAQANYDSTSYQITHEWHTMYLERAGWEKHQERLAAEAKLFEMAKAEFAKEKAEFEKEKKSEEWGLQGLKKKLQATEDTLAEERRKSHVACDKDNQRMFAARTEITNLKARVEALTKSEADNKDTYEEDKSHRERVEVLEVEYSQKLIDKDKDLACTDVVITELQRRRRESHEALEVEKQRGDSLEIELTAEKVKAETAEEARKIANSILNANELDRAVAALTVASQAAGHHAGYLECAAMSRLRFVLIGALAIVRLINRRRMGCAKQRTSMTTFPCPLWTWSPRR
ncbi:hypothetical protein HanXRQr2_Chr13g0572251 [Helianthus annuus]|uniref:Uncharacterized protein n=1 Tax=Helianthus annuus TaxID=4232 RepID=A0A9K3EEG8_HELAN|nr:hypothetical protein HanXRQr2_Chr13g0572251 [Helianthus annuus]KAJ0496522.1 hypothetical protein HanHA89_Chr13g0500761 [Helianthus annuus]